MHLRGRGAPGRMPFEPTGGQPQAGWRETEPPFLEIQLGMGDDVSAPSVKIEERTPTMGGEGPRQLKGSRQDSGTTFPSLR